MLNAKLIWPVFASLFVLLACAQEETKSPTETPETKQQLAQNGHREPHPYGGWYCPDNIIGFPPVNIQELSNVPVISGRLPTKEETQTEASLIFIDPEEYPDAKALDLDLPKVARIHSEHTNMDELIIVIQAVVIDTDTIVGYRFPNGGNGSAWYDQVTFIDDEDAQNLASSPFVFESIWVAANTEDIWKAFSASQYAQDLATHFNKQEFFNSIWTNRSMVHLEADLPSEKATGIVGNIFGNLYLQIDYDYKGFHYSEKMLVLEDQQTPLTKVLFVAGPYNKGFESNQRKWQDFLKTIKEASEQE